MPVDVWPHDPNITPEVHYFAQVAALNDCLYRCIKRRSARFEERLQRKIILPCSVSDDPYMRDD
jgi:hypothetical protein